MAIESDPVRSADLNALLDLLRGRRVVALAGAGMSTESGIPDYRGPDGSLRAREPIRYQEFVGSEEVRVRYWARSAVGWTRVTEAQPNEAHEALARLEAGGVVAGVITQNVDGLHHVGGSRRVVELHGSLEWVKCLDCSRSLRRAEFQERLWSLNGEWADRWLRSPEGTEVEMAPDGDAELPREAVESFRVPGCGACGGMMKPDLVFFGENVPKSRVEEAWTLFEEADALLVAGSSLTVYSGRRFTDRAGKQSVPIAIVNLGPTRADGEAEVKVEGRLGRVLPRVAEGLLGAEAKP